MNISTKRLTKSGSASLTTYGPGTVFFTSRATIGGICIAATPMTCNQGFVAFTPLNGMPPGYLAALLEHYTPEIRSQATGSTFPEIGRGRLGELRVYAHTEPAVQESVTAAVQAATQSVHAIEHRLKTVSEVRSQLLHDLLSGNHEIPESYDRFLEQAGE